MSEPQVLVGIDVSKAQLDMAPRPTEDHWHVRHDAVGIPGLVKRLQAVQPTLIVWEATGGLEVPVTGALAEAGLPVVVVHPRPARDAAHAPAGWPRPTPWRPRAWPTLPRRCGPPRARCPLPRRQP
jgi:transposase